jgi:DNA-binding transcriptional MerR regulator
MTVRNIRAYQARGVLEPPTLVRRTGYYDESHVDRLETVRDLLDSGLTLNAVHGLLIGLSDLASDMTRLLSQVEPEVDPEDAHRRPTGRGADVLPFQRPHPGIGMTPDLAGAPQVIGIIAMNQDPAGMLLARQALHDRWDLCAGELPLDEVYLLIRRLDTLDSAVLDEWIAAMEPSWSTAAPGDSVHPVADAERLEQELNPAAVDFAVALFGLALRRRAAERLAGRGAGMGSTRKR